MTTHTDSIDDADLKELDALRQAVALMGFDPKRLAGFIADRSDHTCKSILLSSMALDEAKLREVGGSNLASWQVMLGQLQASV